ncbi:hypothetical protein E1269_20695 [Jiangella asiatica]|uniref:Uncharacterized protein n=1 Tax=Jiangella asiatica TaxID=2530372 RepID=A0A4R5CUH4_9ACTN|nr:hypothetical protein E1269_20695 [Jiangella asiatica]
MAAIGWTGGARSPSPRAWVALFGVSCNAFGYILLPGLGIGALLGWAEHLRRTGGRRHWRWLTFSPFLFTAVLVRDSLLPTDCEPRSCSTPCWPHSYSPHLCRSEIFGRRSRSHWPTPTPRRRRFALDRESPDSSERARS